MPSGWDNSSATEYYHWAYTDALTMAQETGVVWDGDIPARDSAFSSTVYSREGDFDLYLPGSASPNGATVSPPISIPATTQPVDNHNLIASDRADNQAALRDILRELQR
jgi:hypothetical protein